jgi:hypothetical protein
MPRTNKSGEKLEIFESKGEIRRFIVKQMTPEINRKIRAVVKDIEALNEALRAPN